MAVSGRLRQLMKKYGKVAIGVHLSVSAASITGLYVAIKNNVDVESMFQRVGLPGLGRKEEEPEPQEDKETIYGDEFVGDDVEKPVSVEKTENKAAQLAASTGGALAVAILLNKALFPIRVPITLALTPPVSRFLARRNIIKNHL